MSRHMDFVRVQPCILNSALFQCISEALPCTLMHCVLDSTCYTTLHHPLHLHLHTCCPCLFVCLFVCLFISPSGLFPLIDVMWTSAKSDCTCSIRRVLGRRLRSSLLLNSSPRCDQHCRICYEHFNSTNASLITI